MQTANQPKNPNLAKTNYTPATSKKKIASQIKEPVIKKVIQHRRKYDSQQDQLGPNRTSAA